LEISINNDAQIDRTLELIGSEPGTGIVLVDENGRVLFANNDCLRIFFSGKKTRAEVEGRSLEELGFDQEWIDERKKIIRKVIDENSECLLRTVWEGQQQFSWFRSLTSAEERSVDGDLAHVLVVTRRVPAGQESDYLLEHEMPVVQSDMIDLGALDVLSPRELEVLALIGQGLPTKRIAEIMHRSVKTVGNHRLSLGHKLQKSNKVELALLAREAGLCVEDSTRRRVDHEGSGAASG